MTRTIVQSASTEVAIGFDEPFVVVGERINPSGRAALTRAMLTGDFTLVQAEALAQVAAGARILDVNACVTGLDEAILLVDLIKQLQTITDAPLCIDSSCEIALQKGAEAYKGKALINSVTGTEQSMSIVLPLVAKHGAAVIALAFDEGGISHDPEMRFAVAEKILHRAFDYGIPKADVLIDPLVLPAADDSANMRDLFSLIGRLRRELRVNTICGASNASFGLPNRNTLNAAFLPMLMGAGMTSAIANPLQREVALSVQAGDALLALDASCVNWTSHFG
jgi:5-methyltetrahydrofolate--homocysteine methyltransferase